MKGVLQGFHSSNPQTSKQEGYYWRSFIIPSKKGQVMFFGLRETPPEVSNGRINVMTKVERKETIVYVGITLATDFIKHEASPNIFNV